MKSIQAANIHIVSATVMVLVTHQVHAGGVLQEVEVEPNDSLLSAQVFAPFTIEPYGDFGALVVAASLSPGDVEFFQVYFPQMVLFSAADGAVPSGADPTLIALFDASGAMIDLTNEGALVGSLNPGTYTFAVTGAADMRFVGNHLQSFNYNFQIGWVVIPAPSALAALGMIGLLGRSRRR